MKCVNDSQLLRIHAGQVSLEEMEELNHHFSQCSRCATLRDEINDMAKRFAPDADEFHDQDFTNEVMTLLRTGRADREFSCPARPPFWRAWKTWLLVPATVAATAALLITVWPQFGAERSSEFQARSGLKENPDRWVSLRIYRRHSRGYELVKRDLRSGDALAFAYLNRAASSFRYLMIFAVDHRGNMFWYYPAHIDKNKNPTSIKIRSSSRPTELPDQVRHEWAAGSLRIFGLFSKTPLDVQKVEKLVARQMVAVKTIERLDRIKIAGIGQHSQLLDVVAPSKQGTD